MSHVTVVARDFGFSEQPTVYVGDLRWAFVFCHYHSEPDGVSLERLDESPDAAHECHFIPRGSLTWEALLRGAIVMAGGSDIGPDEATRAVAESGVRS